MVRAQSPGRSEWKRNQELDQPQWKNRQLESVSQTEPRDRALGVRRPEGRGDDLRRGQEGTEHGGCRERAPANEATSRLRLQRDPESRRRQSDHDREEVSRQKIQPQENRADQDATSQRRGTRDRPDDPRQQRHARMIVRVEDLREADPGEDVCRRSEPRAGSRDSEEPQQENHPHPREDPMHDRIDPHRRGKGEKRQERTNRIERAHVGIGRERAPSGDLGNPDGKSTALISVVNRLLDREVVPEQVSASEVAAQEKRIEKNDEDEQDKESDGQPLATDHELLDSERRLRANSPRTAATKTTGPQRESLPPGTVSSHSIRWRPAGTATAENASCAGITETGRPSMDAE